jgi:hypothetical protein
MRHSPDAAVVPEVSRRGKARRRLQHLRPVSLHGIRCGLSLRRLKEAAGWYGTSRQGNATHAIDLHVMQSLAFMHREKLAGRLPPLFPGERSLYEPDAPSCLDRPNTHGYRQSAERPLRLQSLPQRSTLE